jgi:hypothetical protein
MEMYLYTLCRTVYVLINTSIAVFINLFEFIDSETSCQ